MTKLKMLLADRRRRQRGSILSSVLIIVAFLSILVGSLMTELTSSSLLSRTMVGRMEREATVTSAAELAIHQLQAGTVPAVCARDSRGPWFLTLNGSPAAVTQTCKAIVPDVGTGLAPGAFLVDGVHDTTGGRNRYLVTDSSGALRSYTFGQTAPSWSVSIGGAPTGPLLTRADPDGSTVLFVPSSAAGLGCGGHCVEFFNEDGGVPTLGCSMPASTTVAGKPAIEVSAGSRHFPNYVFFGGSGAAGRLYVYDGTPDGSCSLRATSSALGGGVVGAPLVFPGSSSGGRNATVNDEIFVLVSDGNTSKLAHWRYTEANNDCDGGCPGGNGGGVSVSLNLVGSLNLTNQVGGSPVGYAISSPVPVSGRVTIAGAGADGRLATIGITIASGQLTIFNTTDLPGSVSRPPFWCHCPSGDLIGVGNSNGALYLLNANLVLQWTYDGQADGRPAINSTPAADSNGDWYFGADDGYVYDVEPPAAGSQLFKAARFGPGGAVLSSPIVSGCGSGPCIYFASSTAGSYFVRLGGIRVMDLRACVSTSSSSTNCANNPRLWARVEVGSPAVLGGRGVFVQGWSFYSP